MKPIIIVLIMALSLASCKEEKEELKSKSPDGSITLTAHATRSTFVDPWKVNLVAEGEGLKGNVAFEFHASEISDKTIAFQWNGTDSCEITFIEKDDEMRTWLFTPQSTDAMWTDVTKK